MELTLYGIDPEVYRLMVGEPLTPARPDGLVRDALDALYAVDVPTTFSLYGLDPHCGCNVAEFCRNPLHPGPCAGWKKTLKAVAPGVHDMIERDRLEKVAARRKERELAKGGGGKPGSLKGKGKGRDGDGDGKKGEDDSKKDPKKARRKAKEEPPEPDPSDGHPVKLSKETRALVAAAKKALPKDDAGWKALSTEEVTGVPDIDRLNKVNFELYREALKNEEDSKQRWARHWDPTASWEDLERENPRAAKEWTEAEGRVHARYVQEAADRLDFVKRAKESAEQQIAALGGRKPDGKVPDGFKPPPGFQVKSFEPETTFRNRQYPTDPNGRKVPPPELVKMHEAVQKAGDALRTDLAKSIETDPDLVKLRAELAIHQPRAWDYSVPLPERLNARDEVKRIMPALKKRERELVMDALGQIRPMGGKKQTGVTPIKSRSELAYQPGNTKQLKTARRDWEAQLAETTKHLPDEWVDRSNKTPLEVISTDRAFHRNYGDWRGGTISKTTLAMNSDSGAKGVSYDGSFNSYVEEVTYHEFGHRLETVIPGIKALEFAYVRSKTTHNGTVERPVKLKDLYGGGYRDTEIAFKDEFADAYTGKTYEERLNDPINESWEAFQVGLQQTVGRSSRKFGDDSLEAFTLGVMATLGVEA